MHWMSGAVFLARACHICGECLLVYEYTYNCAYTVRLCTESVVSTCYINLSRNSLVLPLEISYKAEATPSLLSPFCCPFMSILKHFDLYAIPYGWCIKPFCRQVIPGSHHINSSRDRSGTPPPALHFVDHVPVFNLCVCLCVYLQRLYK